MVGNVPVALRPEANQQANPHKYEIDNFSSGRFFYGPHWGACSIAPYAVVVNSGDFGGYDKCDYDNPDNYNSEWRAWYYGSMNRLPKATTK